MSLADAEKCPKLLKPGSLQDSYIPPFELKGNSLLRNSHMSAEGDNGNDEEDQGPCFCFRNGGLNFVEQGFPKVEVASEGFFWGLI